MKMRRHRVFLLCTVGLCVISFLHYYKALHYVSLLRELSSPYPNKKSFIMVTDLFWRARLFPLSSASPKVSLTAKFEAWEARTVQGEQIHNLDLGGHFGALVQPTRREELKAKGNAPNDVIKNSWRHSYSSGAKPESTPENSVLQMKGYPSHNIQPHLKKHFRDIHLRTVKLRDDSTPYFVHTKAGALCFRQGTEMAIPKDDSARLFGSASNQRKILQHQGGLNASQIKSRRGKRVVKCVCRQGWHGPYCGVPTMVYHSSLPTKERLLPREVPRRVINAINVNHEFDLLHVRFHELARAVDLFLVCESNFTAYGEERPLQFLHLLLNGTYDYVRHKILYVFLDHFPEGGRQDGWIADDYLRTFLTRNGMSRVRGVRPDDVFIINDADEIPSQEAVLFLKLFDGWTEPFAIHMRKSLYGFFWKQLGSLEVVSGCTVGMLSAVYDDDGIKLRRREYYTMPGFRRYENDTGHILVQWSIGSPVHFAGWHCSWCFTPEGIYLKLISAQNGDFPRWGDYEDKRDLNYIRQLIQTGGWFDGSVQEYPPTDLKEPMYAPKYLLENHDRFHYLLENPYAKRVKPRKDSPEQG